jgi:hypothetical protein
MQPKDDYRDLTDEELEEPVIARRSIEIDQLDDSDTDSDLLEPTGTRSELGTQSDNEQERGPSTGDEMKRIQKDNAGVFDDIKQSWKDNGEVFKEMKREITGRSNPDDGEEAFDDEKDNLEVRQRNTY